MPCLLREEAWSLVHFPPPAFYNFFSKPYLDEDVDVLVASLLHSRGFEATTAKQAG
jgi:hypothetical protein